MVGEKNIRITERFFDNDYIVCRQYLDIRRTGLQPFPAKMAHERKKPGHLEEGNPAYRLVSPGNPAVFLRPVAFRPPITRSLAFLTVTCEGYILSEPDVFVKK